MTKKPQKTAKTTKVETINTVSPLAAPKTLTIGALTLKKCPGDNGALAYAGAVLLEGKQRLRIELLRRAAYDGKVTWDAYAVTRDTAPVASGATPQHALRRLALYLVSQHKHAARQANGALRQAETDAAKADRIGQVCAYVAALA